MEDRKSYVYIITNKYNSVLYIGVTSDIVKRIWEHKTKQADSFSIRYKLTKLVYYEVIDNIETAIEREKQLKRWHREWKMNLIREQNPEFVDLYDTII